MPRYTVELRIVDWYNVEVEAEDKNAAMEAAREHICQLEGEDLEALHSGCEGFEAVSISPGWSSDALGFGERTFNEHMQDQEELTGE
jgi:hypothetical protein